MVNYKLGKLLAYYFQWLTYKVLAQGDAIEHSLWEDVPFVSLSKMRIIVSKQSKGKFFYIIFVKI